MLQFLPQLVADLCLSVCQMVGVDQVVLWDFTIFIGWKHSCLLQLENELLKPESVSHNSQVSDQDNQNNQLQYAKSLCGHYSMSACLL